MKNGEKRRREPTLEELEDMVSQVLENPFWLRSLTAGKTQTRLHDDHDGTMTGIIGVNFDQNGDAWVFIEDAEGATQSLRFRSFAGGGRSPRTRAALMILAEAIRLDQEERPDPE